MTNYRTKFILTNFTKFRIIEILRNYDEPRTFDLFIKGQVRGKKGRDRRRTRGHDSTNPVVFNIVCNKRFLWRATSAYCGLENTDELLSSVIRIQL